MRRRYLDPLSFNVGLSSRWRGWAGALAALRVDVGRCVRLALPYIFIVFYLV